MPVAAAAAADKQRDAFLKGLDDLIAKPALDMKDEFGRDDQWTDWKGITYSAREVSGGPFPSQQLMSHVTVVSEIACKKGRDELSRSLGWWR